MTLNLIQGNPQIPANCPVCGAALHLATTCPKCGRRFVAQIQKPPGANSRWPLWAAGGGGCVLAVLGVGLALRQPGKTYVPLPIPQTPQTVANEPHSISIPPEIQPIHKGKTAPGKTPSKKSPRKKNTRGARKQKGT
jgi:hypothetical protein